jgi:hypothetical protein
MDTIDLTKLNYAAVVLAGVGHMITGLVWFSKPLFGPAWVRLTQQEMTPARQWLPVAAVGHLVIGFALAVLMAFAGVTSLLGGLVIAWIAWLGFVVTLEIGELVWEKIPFELFLLRAGNHFVALSVAGLVLAAWR